MTIRYYLILPLILPVLFSCVDTRKVTYFNDLPDAQIPFQVESLEPVIQKNDVLSITVSSLNPDATQLLNVPNTPTSQTISPGTLAQAIGYLVDEEGNIQFPLLGTIQAEGLTKKQLKETIVQGILKKRLLLEPIVNIRYLNYKVSVLGEVARPGLINIPGEKVSLLEAVALAGDLTLYARRDNVLLIREVEGKRITKHINLNDQELFTSPYYYLKSNDLVYVTPNKARVASTSNSRTWLPIAFSALSFVTILVDRLTR